MKRLVISNEPLTFLFGIQILWATLSYSFQFWQDDTTDYKVTYNYELVPDFESSNVFLLTCLSLY